MAECMLERSDRKYKYTPEAMDELQKSLKVLNKMFCDSLKALQGDDGIEPGKMMKMCIRDRQYRNRKIFDSANIKTG